MVVAGAGARSQPESETRLRDICGFARQAKLICSAAELLTIWQVCLLLYLSDKSFGAAAGIRWRKHVVSDMNVVACAELSNGFIGVSKMETALFQQTGQKLVQP